VQLVKTLYLSGLEERRINDRDIFNTVAPYGFIRRISFHKTFAFVEFDTYKDAQKANRELKKREEELGFRVCYARSEKRCDLSNLSIPLSDLIEPTHPFWFKLQNLLYEQ
jgi:RNA recognition motif-containing protein